MTQSPERLILAIPAGPQIPGQPRHSEGSRLALPTHSFLQKGIGLDYTLGRQYFAYVEGQPIEIAEFRGADIPRIVAEGGAHAGIVGLDHVLNLYEDELEHVEILRKLGYGLCTFNLGVPEGMGYTEDSTIEDVANLRVATALPVLAQKIFRERRVPVRIVPMEGHVENAIRYSIADVIVDITESGNTMRGNGLIPTLEPLRAFEAVVIANMDKVQVTGKHKAITNLLTRVDKALRSDNWKILDGGITEIITEPAFGNGLDVKQEAAAS